MQNNKIDGKSESCSHCGVWNLVGWHVASPSSCRCLQAYFKWRLFLCPCPMPLRVRFPLMMERQDFCILDHFFSKSVCVTFLCKTPPGHNFPFDFKFHKWFWLDGIFHPWSIFWTCTWWHSLDVIRPLEPTLRLLMMATILPIDGVRNGWDENDRTESSIRLVWSMCARHILCITVKGTTERNWWMRLGRNQEVLSLDTPISERRKKLETFYSFSVS
jgi:hypothetical protein